MRSASELVQVWGSVQSAADDTSEMELEVRKAFPKTPTPFNPYFLSPACPTEYVPNSASFHTRIAKLTERLCC